MSDNAKILIVGAGNPLRRDDGIGSYLIDQLKASQKLVGLSVDLLDGGTDGLDLLDLFQQYPHVLLIDAVNMGETPGKIRLFTPTEAKIAITGDSLSTHTLGIGTLIGLMEELKVETDLKIIGIQPEDISLGEGLTETIASKVDELIQLVIRVVGKIKL